MIKKILVPLDGSKLAEKALSHTCTLAEKFEAEIILVQVIQPMSILPTKADAVFYRLEQERTAPYIFYEHLEANLSDLYLSSVQHKLSRRNILVRTTTIEEYLEAEAIIDLARQEAVDLIVMSTHGRSGVKRWVCGSVAEQLLRYAPCPICLVRTEEPEC